MTGGVNSGGYFDWAASSVPDRDIWREALDISMEHFGNPSSIHRYGIAAADILAEARRRCAAALGVPAESLFFTSGGTEANHLPILSLLQRPAAGSILISAIEHPAVREQALMMRNLGWKVHIVRPGRDGIITPEAVTENLTDDTALVCIMAVNNETGVVQPIYRIAEAITAASAGRKRPKFHVDAVQGVGKIPLDFSFPGTCSAGVDTCGIDSAAVSAHKIQGPRGIGLLYMPRRQEPFVRGGGQEGGIRSGTENLFGAWALSRCLEKYAFTGNEPARNGFRSSYEEALIRMDDFIRFLETLPCARIIPQTRGLQTRTPESGSLTEGGLSSGLRFSPWIIQVSFEGIPGEVLVRSLSERGISISTGSACSARKLSRPVLEAMKVPKQQALEAVRISFGPLTREEDMQALRGALEETVGMFSRHR
ncbi:MAG: cysteine desulfurase [Spirochaetaceae bacterium]|jgi:cysteine desulfurase|nr:cysteine desulfurase [Spirochaetaceae bacterium]